MDEADPIGTEALAEHGGPILGGSSIDTLITVVIVGQIVMALWLDHLGALGLPREPLNAGKILGAALVLAGVILVRRS